MRCLKDRRSCTNKDLGKIGLKRVTAIQGSSKTVPLTGQERIWFDDSNVMIETGVILTLA
jgi:hypothetical protein